MTDDISIENQIRFAQKKRVERRFHSIAKMLTKQWTKNLTLHIYNKLHLDRGTIEFLEALEALEKSKELDDSIPEIFSLLGFLYRETNQQNKSLESYEQAWFLQSKNPQICYDLAYTMAELNKYKDSLLILDGLNILQSDKKILPDILSLKAEWLAAPLLPDFSHNHLI